MCKEKVDGTTLGCNLNYDKLWMKLYRNEITQEEFDTWFDAHCKNCKYMSEVCMYGEE